jgi:hypothetical protein
MRGGGISTLAANAAVSAARRAPARWRVGASIGSINCASTNACSNARIIAPVSPTVRVFIMVTPFP